MKRSKNEILKEIDETNHILLELRATGAPENELGFYEGWLQALAWVLTNSNLQEEGES